MPSEREKILCFYRARELQVRLPYEYPEELEIVDAKGVHWRYLTHGNYNWIYTAEVDVSGPEGQSSKQTLTLKIQRDCLSGAEKIADLPERAVRIFKIINPGIDVDVVKDSEGRVIGWSLPFLPGRSATPVEAGKAMLEIYRQTGQILADGFVYDNFRVLADGRVICIDIGAAVRIDMQVNNDSEAVSETGLEFLGIMKAGYDGFCRNHASSHNHGKNIQVYKALVVIQQFRPDVRDVEWLYEPQHADILRQLATAYDQGTMPDKIWGWFPLDINSDYFRQSDLLRPLLDSNISDNEKQRWCQMKITSASLFARRIYQHYISLNQVMRDVRDRLYDVLETKHYADKPHSLHLMHLNDERDKSLLDKSKMQVGRCYEEARAEKIQARNEANPLSSGAAYAAATDDAHEADERANVADDAAVENDVAFADDAVVVDDASQPQQRIVDDKRIPTTVDSSASRDVRPPVSGGSETTSASASYEERMAAALALPAVKTLNLDKDQTSYLLNKARLVDEKDFCGMCHPYRWWTENKDEIGKVDALLAELNKSKPSLLEVSKIARTNTGWLFGGTEQEWLRELTVTGASYFKRP